VTTPSSEPAVSTRRKREPIGLRVVRPRPRASIPECLRHIEALVTAGAAPTRIIDLKALMHGGPQRDEPLRVGDLQVWELVNETSQDHPFHLHGFFVQVVDETGTQPPVPAWKDTVNVPRKSRATIAWLPDDRPGSGCTTATSSSTTRLGMMAHFEVVS
jgi:hypothetical protein